MTRVSNSDTRTLPVIPIRDGIIYPGTEAVLTFGRSKSVSAIEAVAGSGEQQLVLVMQRKPNINNPTPEELYEIGTTIQIVRMFKNDGEINALVRGLDRVHIVSYESFDPYYAATVVEVPDMLVDSDEVRALAKHIVGQLRRAVNMGKAIDFLVFMNIMSDSSPAELSNHVANVLDIKSEEKQELLEITDIKTRLDKINHYLTHETKVLELERKIASKSQKQFDKSVRENVLKQRLKTIEQELGKSDGNKELKELEQKIKKAQMPEEVEKKAYKELSRLSQMSQYNPESSYLRTYLDWLVELPWSKTSENNVDMQSAEKVLDEDHYGLNKIKERIIEYLAVMKLKRHHETDTSEQSTPKQKSADKQKSNQSTGLPTILCFVGPPGVGKTSLGRSIARSLGREFVRISLGGIRDEAEIRGHRRTYVGALPGRIIQGIKQAGTKNPVFMLDEIDKVGADFRGDPSAALLEALDPEQNVEFSDHYLEAPFDLSNVFFITTCNVLDTIPHALRDRLEIIHFPGYTEDEKFNIAKSFLIDKQIAAHGLDDARVSITNGALRTMIQRYTREAGVRNLERQIAKISRKSARKVAAGNNKTIAITSRKIAEYLGPARYSATLADKKDEVGVSTGLAWTQAGGDVLFIEVALMPGKGQLVLTGQLGNVMKESCQAAMSYIRSRWKVLGLSEKFYQKLDVHIHVPEGAVSKDGPSAGIAITTAIASALTKILSNRLVGMSGEVTLRGKVLEVGGIKEKVIAAHRGKLKTVILPKQNKKDLEDIPKHVLRDLRFKYVEHMDEVLGIALKKQLPKIKMRTGKREEKSQDVGLQYAHVHA